MTICSKYHEILCDIPVKYLEYVKVLSLLILIDYNSLVIFFPYQFLIFMIIISTILLYSIFSHSEFIVYKIVNNSKFIFWSDIAD